VKTIAPPPPQVEMRAGIDPPHHPASMLIRRDSAMTSNLSTMRPLLTRLRDRPKDHLLLHEAADEIERLMAENEELRRKLSERA
jgi:hypothetical protein